MVKELKILFVYIEQEIKSAFIAVLMQLGNKNTMIKKEEILIIGC